MRRVLIGTVGYHNLRDYSIGPMLLSQLKALEWPPFIAIEEMNWGPIAIVQNLESLSQPYDRIVLVSARSCGRRVGAITLRRWLGGLPNKENIQARISEAVTGVISIDNLLVIGEFYKAWPDEVIVVDIEPGAEKMGQTFSPEVAAAVPDILNNIRHMATEDLNAIDNLVGMRGERLQRDR